MNTEQPTPTTITDQFTRDIAKHEMLAMRDDGVNRHLRFKRPGTMFMHFDILTWPGYLCYMGDMGTFVFRRTTDMLEFFRAGKNDKPYRIDFRYWAEKVEAADKGDGLEAFSAEKFKAEVRDYFEQATADANDWTAEPMSRWHPSLYGPRKRPPTRPASCCAKC